MGEILVALLAGRSALELYTDVELGAYRLNVPSLFGLALLGLAAWPLIQRGRSVAWHPLLSGWVAWLLALLPAVGVGLWLHGSQGLFGVREWIRLLSIPSVFLIAYNLPPRPGWRSGPHLLLLVLAIPLAAAIVQLVLQTGTTAFGGHRVMGTLFHPNSLALFLVFFLGLTYWTARSSGRWPWLILIAVELQVFVATLSLGGLLMLAALGGWIFLREDARGRALLLGFAVLVTVLLAANHEARTKLQTMHSFAPARISGSIQAGEYDDSLGWRYHNWSGLVSVWRQRPLLGWGLNQSQFVNPVQQTGVGYAAHNDVLRALVETGAFGLVAYAAFVCFCAYQMLRAAGPRDAGVSLAWILTGVFLVGQAGSLGDNVLANSAFQLCLWSALGFELRRRRER
jgi:O-antigen ligase